MRALYGTKACAHCRASADFVIFTDEPEKRFEDFAQPDFSKVDDALGIKYEKNEIYEDTVLLLRYNCPDPSCDVACYGWPDLHRHVKGTHHKVLCDLCTRYKKVFTHEHELFTHAALNKHQRHGDDNPGAIDQSGFKGHPECGFCQQRFYGDDELYVHCREKHEKCHICDRRNNGRNTVYYENYDTLETHFSQDHFLCPDSECLEKKFVVFESEMDLKAHQLKDHPNGLSKDARRDARRVDMSTFDYRSPHTDERRVNGNGSGNNNNRREGRGRGRGRDPNAEPIPQSSAQPLSRAEVAYQRQLAIHSAQSVSTRTFGGQLTSTDGAIAARPQPNTRTPPTVSAPRESSAAHNAPRPNGTDSSLSSDMSALDLGTSTPSHLLPAPGTPLTAAERARQQRHAALTERVSNLLHHAATSLATFRTHVSSYRTSSITAPALIEALHALFSATNTSAEQLGTVIKELAELFEAPAKKQGLLAAWNDWRAINEDYPDLPGLTPTSSTASTPGAGKRILKLKSSTAQSSRAAAASNNRPATLGWASTLGAGASRPPAREAFPGLPSAQSSAKGPSKMGWGPGAAPGLGSAAGSAASSRNASRAPAPARAPAPGLGNAELFPALPAGAKLSMNVSRPGYTGNPYLRNVGSGTSTPVNAWSAGTGSGASTPGAGAQLDGGAAEDEAGKRKGKGRKKQVLMGWG